MKAFIAIALVQLTDGNFVQGGNFFTATDEEKAAEIMTNIVRQKHPGGEILSVGVNEVTLEHIESVVDDLAEYYRADGEQ